MWNEIVCGECDKAKSFTETRGCSFKRCNQTSYCVKCETTGCDTIPCEEHETCWKSHASGSKRAREHTPIDAKAQLFIQAVTHSEANAERQRAHHQRDEAARWFCVRRDRINVPNLYVYDRFLRICDPELSGNRRTRAHYPSFVSFVGKTSVGKSTLIRAMILMSVANQRGPEYLASSSSSSPCGDAQPSMSEQLRSASMSGPVTRSSNVEDLTQPTTHGVHLYDGGWSATDMLPDSAGMTFPIALADCEGSGAGFAMTNAESGGMGRSSGGPDDELHRRPRSQSRLASANNRERSRSRRNDLVQEIEITADCYRRAAKRGVDLFYARLLYAVSDVIVFVTKEDQQMEPELIAVLEWAAKGVHHSMNYPQKTLIIVRNMPALHNSDLNDCDTLKSLYLYPAGRKNLWEYSEENDLKEFVEAYNRRQPKHQHQIRDNRDLYGALFRDISCCCIPNRNSASDSEMFDQYCKLRDRIERAVGSALAQRRRCMMLYNVAAQSHILGRAFEHFSTSESPFDFHDAARRINPNPTSITGHMANFFRIALEAPAETIGRDRADKIVTDIVPLVLLIQIARFSDLTTPPDSIFDRDLEAYLRDALSTYENVHERCDFVFPPDRHCVVRANHVMHRSTLNGEFEAGFLKHKRSWTRLGDYSQYEWITGIRQAFIDRYHSVFRDEGTRLRPGSMVKDPRLRALREKLNKDYHKDWRHFMSNKTCLGCIQSIPDHVLPCGHAYCVMCVQELGEPSDLADCSWTMSNCFLCWDGDGHGSHLIILRPRLAGVRLLSLDGGGIRGIIELAILREISTRTDLDIPVRSFFDLIVGTSTGGIIALSLAMSTTPIEKVIDFFKETSEKTFSRKYVGKFDPFHLSSYAVMLFKIYNAFYDEIHLREALKDHFGPSTSLFAPARGNKFITYTRVAVTAAKTGAETNCIIPNYNCPLGGDDDTSEGAISTELEEKEEHCMKIWEAGMATSAAPKMLPPFVKRETGVDYVDGAVYANCPAQVAYEQMGLLWPGDSAQLDILLSVGTGSQAPRLPNIPEVLRNMGFLHVVSLMVQKQLDSKLSWQHFETGTCPKPDRPRLKRLSPPIGAGKRVELYDWTEMGALERLARNWCNETERDEIDRIADTLLGTLFFFEPHDGSSSEGTKETEEEEKNDMNEKETTTAADSDHVDRMSLTGSIRCRLRHQSPELESLLTRVDSFWHAHAPTAEPATALAAPNNWRQVLGGHNNAATTNDEGEGRGKGTRRRKRRISDALSEMLIEEHGRRKFRIPLVLSARRDTHLFEVLAVKFKGRPDMVLLSGFPSRLSTLMERSRQIWLQ